MMLGMRSAILPAGKKLGPYEIVNSLGAGGMGAVYRARDPKLRRDVAIKALPEEFSNDEVALARFQREAETLASLSHPNVGAIYDLLELEGARFLILELIEGENLSARIGRGPIPLEEALPLAKQIAEALEAAHEKGVTHRDLKPANVRLTPTGVAKVLDFGLAKSQTSQSAVLSSDAPTVAATTTPGMILGTPAYMSPEQAKGRETDRTADVWAFGCVFYEMLTGRPAFEGETASEVLAEVLKSEPKWDLLPAGTPQSIRRLLQRCLRKDPRARLRDIGDARIEITDAINNPEAPPPAARSKERLAWPLLAGVAVVALLAGVAIAHFLKPAEVDPALSVDIAAGPSYMGVSLAISPDGRKIVYSGVFDNHSQLFIRNLDSSDPKPLPGTNSGTYPFWSPDSKKIGFFADAKLKTIDLEKNAIQVLTNAVNPRGGTWNRNDVILFTPVSPGVIYRIPAAGGKTETVTQIDPNQAQYILHVFPEFLPDGDHFLYYVNGSAQSRGVYVSSLSAPKPERVLETDSSAVYASSGYLLFLQKSVLVAQAFDLKTLKVSGSAIPISDHMGNNQARTAVSASAAGPFVYRTVGTVPTSQTAVYSAWFDRSGKEVSVFPGGLNGHWSLSGDDKSLITERTTNANIDIWRVDASRGLLSPLTMDAAADTFPTWAPDGEHFVFTSNRKGLTYDLYVGSVNRPGGEELLLSSSENKIATDWSADGKYVLYRNLSPDTGYDLWALPITKDFKKAGEPILVAQTPGDERDGQFSPDGNWVAYQSNKSGSFEVYVDPFPGPGAKYQVSQNGGAQVRWNRNGKELFYIAPDARLMSVAIRLDPTGKNFESGNPMPLFLTSLRGLEVQTTNRQQYAVSADGQRFVSRSGGPAPDADPIRLLIHWQPK
jgi:serine/threonine protein kinase